MPFRAQVSGIHDQKIDVSLALKLALPSGTDDHATSTLGGVTMLAAASRNTSRLEGFSDAVFAFAATLLVVSLEVPKDFDALVSQLYGFAAFAVTFGALVAIWTIHRAFYHRYGLGDGWTVVLNSGLLFVVLFYVVPLKFLTESLFSGLLGIGSSGITVDSIEELAQLFMLYSAGFAAIFLFITLLYWHAWRRRAVLGLDARQAWEAAYLSRHYLLFALVGLLSIGMAAAAWGVQFGLPGFFYVILGPACYAHGVWSQQHRPPASAARPTAHKEH
jgi:uncharacterized membrane protein